MKSLFTILLFCIVFTTTAQNLVPNPSFEEYDTCPNNMDQLNYVVGWENFSQYSPDYFNSCNPCNTPTDGCFSVPYNWGGYQQAATGNAYAGIYTREEHPWITNIREFIGAQLNSPMIIGTKYFASFKVNLSLNGAFNTATDKLGILFSTVLYNSANPAPINNFAHIYSTTIITDTVNWTIIKGSIIADSAYQYVIIGGFFDDDNTNFIRLLFDSTSTIPLAAYYFIDNVFVSTDSVDGISEYELTNKIKIFPNPASAFITIEINPQLKHSVEVTLLDVMGSEIIKTQIVEISSITIPTSDFNNGLYLLKIKSCNNIFTKKIIITH